MHKVLKELHPDLLTVIVPRHSHRGKGIANQIRQDYALSVARRSLGEAISAETDIYIADTMGELGIFYRLAGIVFVGGSLVPHGGQNPLEAARLDCAILYGPHIDNFSAICRELETAGAARMVQHLTLLEEAVDQLLRNQEQQEMMAKAALALLERKGGVVDALMAQFAPILRGLEKESRELKEPKA